MGKHPLPGYGPVAHGNRLVRTRMLGGVGAGGEIPPATRLNDCPFDEYTVGIPAASGRNDTKRIARRQV